jgi:hypothetical protein
VFPVRYELNAFFMKRTLFIESRDTAVGIETGYGLGGRGVRVPVPQQVKYRKLISKIV